MVIHISAVGDLLVYYYHYYRVYVFDLDHDLDGQHTIYTIPIYITISVSLY